MMRQSAEKRANPLSSVPVCVISATLGNSLRLVIVRHDFPVPLYPIYYSERGCVQMQTGVGSMKSQVVKRSIVVAGHKTSVSLEDAFWKGLKEIAGGRHMTLSDLVATIDSERQYGNLSSAIRLFVLDFYRNQLSVEQTERDGTQTIVINRPVPLVAK